jgi:hypothetical protein
VHRKTLLGGEVELLGSQLMFNPPGSVGFSPHQDDFYTRTDRPDDVITVWSAADRVDVENGALDGFPGSHMQGMVPLKKDYKYLLPKAPEMAKNGTRMLAPRNALSIPRYLPQSRKSHGSIAGIRLFYPRTFGARLFSKCVQPTNQMFASLQLYPLGHQI